ncbi:hypothetical protein HDV63DRAFT_15613 [Trichoderma sp. SZMC 28014]
MLHAVQRPGPLPPSRSPPFRRCALLTVIPTPVSCLHFAQPEKARLPVCLLLTSYFHTLLRTGFALLADEFAAYPFQTATLTLCFAYRALARLASFFCLFAVSLLRRTPAQLSCYESERRLGIPSAQIQTVLSTVDTPSRAPLPKDIAKFSSNSCDQAPDKKSKLVR